MIGAILAAGLVSLTPYQKHQWFEGPDHPAIRPCRGALAWGACQLPAGLSAADAQALLAGQATAWRREGGELLVVASRHADQAYLCCSPRAKMQKLAGDLWAVRAKIADFDKGLIEVTVVPQGERDPGFIRGKEAPPKGSAYVELDPTDGGGAGLQIVGGSGGDHFVVAFDEASQTFAVTAKAALAIGPGCTRPPGLATSVSCAANGPGRWLMADLGPGNDSLTVEGSLKSVGSVRLAGGDGNDSIKGGPEDDLIESGRGADKLYGGDGADGLVGGLPGPTFLYGEGSGDLLAAGGGCAGGALVGGPGRDDASFAETQAHPGLLIISFPAHAAWIDVIKGCRKVHLSPTDEDMEGSFDWDVLIGNHRPNSMLGQPGEDSFYGNGGEDVIDARDGVRDKWIQCGRGTPAKKGRPATGTAAGRALTDPFDPEPFKCKVEKNGHPVPGLNG